jgi:pyruvate kinase
MTNHRRPSPVRQTKIVATVGPASDNEQTLERLIRAGVDVFRLNFSHGTHQEHSQAVRLIRRIAAREDCAVALLQDLQGPRLRTGSLVDGGPAILIPGQPLVLTTEEVPGTAERVSVNYAQLPRDVGPGDRLLIADGAFELRVDSTTDTEVRTRVVRGGSLGERKGINAPGVHLTVTSPTEKDLQDLALGVSLGIDYVAISFVRDAREVEATREALDRLGAPHVPVIAKLERGEAIVNLDDILRASDGVMVARGDLGVELGAEKVPMVQKAIIRKANQQRIPVITATQMLESMVASPHPTRAEASDVANAILDGTDAVMLSAETTLGRYPVEAVQTMDRIAREVESFGLRMDRHAGEIDRASRSDLSLAHAAASLAAEVDARAIVVFTADGHTARLLSTERPSVPIYAFTSNRSVYRRLALWHGVVPLRGDFQENTDGLIETMLAELRRRGYIRKGDDVVITRLSAGEQRHLTNFITIRTVTHGP